MLVLTQARKGLLAQLAEADLEARVHAAARLAADAEDPELRESTVDALYGVWAAWERRGRRKAKVSDVPGARLLGREGRFVERARPAPRAHVRRRHGRVARS